MCMLRVLQVPQTQIRDVYIDEMGMPASQCSSLTVKQFAERYARYRLKRSATLTEGAYSDEKRDAVMEKYEKQFKKYWKERIKLDEGEEATKAKTLKQLKQEYVEAQKAGDQEAMEEAKKGYRKQKMSNVLKNAIKKLQNAIDAETDPEKKAKLQKKLEELEKKTQDNTTE